MYNSNKNEMDMIDKFRSLFEDCSTEFGICNPTTDFIKLSTDQQRALSLFNSGSNLLIMGSAGVGKSFLIKEMKYQTMKNTDKKIVITATTGIAAYNINGITINSFMGIGTGEKPVEYLLRRIRNKFVVQDRIRRTDILIIDEISMASAELFEKINLICQSVRKNNRLFGGIQVILTGDFLQLLPVFNKNPKFFPNQDTRLLFESELFQKYFTKRNIILLTSNFRQSDKLFIELLLRLRKGNSTKSDIDVLKSRLISNIKQDFNKTVYLVSSNKHAQTINQTNLTKNPNQPITFTSSFNEEGDTELCKDLTTELNNQFEQKGINTITLKKGVRVMLLKNLSVEEGLVNGSVGTIIDFQTYDLKQYPLVHFDNRIKRLITPVEWQLELNDSKVTAVQLPLMLCWAITIHKSQSLTLEKAVLYLDDCFCDSQVYVALSRVKSLDGVFLKSFNENKIFVNSKVKAFLSNFE